MHDPFLKDKKLLVGLSGSSAVLGLPAYLGVFRAIFKEVKVIMTEAATKLIAPSTILLFCDEVFIDEDLGLEKKMNHVELARWADLFIILPATANVIGQAANGIALNLLTSTILASPNPVMFFPNMNRLMWTKKVVQRNVSQLREDNHIVVTPLEAMAYEIASGTMQPNYILPPGQTVIQEMKNTLLEREEETVVST
ncbi:Mersacidin decarboxylase [Brevibacillus laterosporus]|uniref:Mersacidin decarboxylase n=1 Tax=Brevibacillus laterosporus TaxID=1465 RepID=A0A518V711_BRELA|nr:flavoprotein [Brevibacillus laterosporus]QDX92811.1 Mersacidin decarboxylase [Brevibacillus laterosporus]TPG71120.1 Mersacidin decarboxylase [Brevibacillus laterosporus]